MATYIYLNMCMCIFSYLLEYAQNIFGRTNKASCFQDRELGGWESGLGG